MKPRSHQASAAMYLVEAMLVWPEQIHPQKNCMLTQDPRAREPYKGPEY